MLLTIVIFVIILGLVVFIHELGHFMVARWFGVKVEEFGFGLPPRLWGKKFGNTIYSINWLPLGGFVRLKGQDGDEKDERDSFAAKRPWQRITILSAGVIMNIVLAIVIFSIGYMIGMPSAVSDTEGAVAVSERRVQIVDVVPDSVAVEIGLVPGDEILRIDGQDIFTTEEVTNYIRSDEDRFLNLEIGRLGEVVQLQANLAEQERAELGVYLAETGVVRYGFFRAWWEGARAAVSLLVQIVTVLYLMLRNLIVGGAPVTELAGPVAVAVL
ncbi:MAG: site-2 protease family protein, partial [Candidatus Komeilibacteria bacterium]|nr:site-2 protease family protein [Candidatus Komeilibacteria bacterium]